MAGKVKVRTLWGSSYETMEPRTWNGYNVTRKVAKIVPYAEGFGKWYVYRHPEGEWSLIHGETGLSAGYGKTIRKACETLAIRSEEQIAKAVESKAELARQGFAR